MAKLTVGAETSAPSSGKQVIEEKKTVTIDLPPGVTGEPSNGRVRRKAPHINVWFAGMPPDERAHDWVYTLYRDDSRIIIVDENLDDRASGTMLYKFLPDEIKALPEGPFQIEMGSLIQERFGGGEFHLMVNSRKFGTMKYNKGLKLFGEPKLSAREDWKDGQNPAYSGRGEGGSMMPLLLRITDDINKKIDAVAAGRQEGTSAVADVAKAIMDSNSQAFKWAMDNMPKSADPQTQLQMYQMMFNMMKELFEKKEAAPVKDPIEQFTQFLTMFKTIREMDRPPAGSVQTGLDGVPQGSNLKDLVREAVAAAWQSRRGAGGGTDWGQFVGQALNSPAVANFLMAGAGWLRSKIAAKPGASPPATVTINRGGRIRKPYQPATGEPAQPSSTPTLAGRMAPRPMRGEQPVDSAQESEAQTTPETTSGAPAEQIEITPEVAQAVLFEYAAHQIVDLFKHNEPGNIVAGAIDRIFPELAVQLRFMNEDILRGFISNNPTLAEIKDDPRLPKFLAEFVAYFKQIEEPEGQ